MPYTWGSTSASPVVRYSKLVSNVSHSSIDPVYTNALLATLNVRETLRGHAENIHTDATGKVTLSLRSLSSPGSSLVSFGSLVFLMLILWLTRPYPLQQNGPQFNINTIKGTVTDLQEQARHDKEKIAVRFSVYFWLNPPYFAV